MVYKCVKFAKGCLPSQLGTTYFSSSPKVQRLIKSHGIENFTFEIRQIFNDINKARTWETKILTKFLNHPKFLNIHKNDGFCKIDNSGCKNPMYGTIAPNRGIPHKQETIQKISESCSGEKNGFYGKHHSEEFKQRRSDELSGISMNIGEDNPFYGKTHSDENRVKISQAVKERFDKRFQGNTYHTPHGTFCNLRDSELQNLSYLSVHNWCSTPDRKITQQMTIRSKYLTKNMIGKTFREIGFWID